MAKANYSGGFRDGIVLRGVPLQVLHPGKVFWVSNASAAALPGHKGARDSGPGTFDEPFATIDYAVGQCSGGRGDIIMVKPGYTQTITTAAQLVLDVANVAIVGCGTGTLRPTLTFATNDTANIPVSAANITIYNMLFVANVADVVSAFTVTGTALATDLTIANSEFRDTSSALNFLAVLTGNATAQSLQGLHFADNDIVSLGTTAATTAIKALAAASRVKILRNFGPWAVLNDTAAMFDGSTFDFLQMEIGGNVLNKPNTSSTGGSFFSGTGTDWTGHAHHNLCWQLDNSAGIWIAAATKLAFSENYSPITGAAEKSGLINPAAV